MDTSISVKKREQFEMREGGEHGECVQSGEPRSAWMFYFGMEVWGEELLALTVFPDIMNFCAVHPKLPSKNIRYLLPYFFPYGKYCGWVIKWADQRWNAVSFFRWSGFDAEVRLCN